MLNIISSSRYKIDRASIHEQVEKIFSNYPITPQSVLNIVFVGKKKMNQYSRKYKGEDVALPVLSFSYLNQKETDSVKAGSEKTESGNVAEEEKVIGEVIICYPQAVLLAAERDKKVDYIITSLVKHGIENVLKS